MIEDMYYGKENSKKTKKKGSKLLLFIILIVFLLILALCAYYYLIGFDEKTTKELFVGAVENSNISTYVTDNIYDSLSEKLKESNSNIKSTVTFTNEGLDNGIDYSAFELNLNIDNDITNKKSSYTTALDYSGNEILNFKVLTDENRFAIFSDDIVKKYVGVNKEDYSLYPEIDSLMPSFVSQITDKSFEELEDTFLKTDSVDLSEKDKVQYIKDYYSTIDQYITEDMFSSQDNYALQINDEQVSVKAYTLTLDTNKLKDILLALSNKVKNDEELQKAILKEDEEVQDDNEDENIVNLELTNTASNEDIEEATNNTTENQVTDEDDNNIEEPNDENTTNETTEETVELQGQINEINTETSVTLNVNTENEESSDEEETANQEDEIEAEDEEDNGELEITDVTSIDIDQDDLLESSNDENDEEEIIYDKDFNSELVRLLLLGRKLDITEKEFDKYWDDFTTELITEITSYGDITITVYVSDEKTERIDIKSANNNINVEIYFKTISETLNEIEITFLGNIQFPWIEETEEVSANNGFSLKYSKSVSSSKTTYSGELDLITEGKVIDKYTILNKYDGTVDSKSIINEMVVKGIIDGNTLGFSTESTIKFSKSDDIEDLTDDNCLMLESLTDEELTNVNSLIVARIQEIIDDRKSQMNFIDTNNSSAVVKSSATIDTTVTEEEAKSRIQKAVDNISSNEDWSLLDLESETITGATINSISEENANITIGSYTFNVNQSLEITLQN